MIAGVLLAQTFGPTAGATPAEVGALFPDGEIQLFRPRPSEVVARDVFQINFSLQPAAMLALGPALGTEIRLIFPFRLYTGVGLTAFPDQNQRPPILNFDLTLGYAFGGFARGAWIGISGGVMSKTQMDWRIAPALQLGWDFRIGNHFSIGPFVSYTYLDADFAGTNSDGTRKLGLGFGLPLRFWF